jgi:hypothetical protein
VAFGIARRCSRHSPASPSHNTVAGVSAVTPATALTLAVWKAFPEHPPYEGKHSDIIPHLTVAQEAEEQVLRRIGSELGVVAERFLPLPARATEVALMDNSSGPWRVVTTFTLGGL